MVIEFGDFRFDPTVPLLTRDSRSVGLAPKALEILAALVRKAGHVVRKDHLLGLVWPDTVVEEGNLAVHISSLRRSLEGSGNRGAYIETVAKVGYRFAAPIRLAGQPAEAPKASIQSLAVLPFGHACPETEYLSDGITETLINSLVQLPGVRVAPRCLVFAYKGSRIDPVEVGAHLAVEAVLTGRVMRRGGRLNVQADLIDVARAAQVWGRQYDRPLGDILGLQEEIVREVSRRLRTPPDGDAQPFHKKC